MKALDVVSRLMSILPTRTDKFTTSVPVESMTRSAGVVTVACLEKHGLEPDDVAVIVGAVVPIAATSITRAGTVATATLATKHDLTPAVAKLVTFSGAAEPEFNGTFPVLSFPDNTTIRFEVPDSGPASATGSPTLEGGESALRQYDGAYKVLETPSESEFTFAFSTTLPDPIGSIEARVKPRVSAAASIERVLDVYTEKKFGELWAFVVLEDVVASKNRAIRSDATDNLGSGNEFRQQIIQPFTVYTIEPAEGTIAGRENRDEAEDLFRPLCRSVLGARFDSRLYVGQQGAVQFVSHGAFRYDSATYVHAFSFEQTVDLDTEDTVGPALDVAFECVDLTAFPDLPGDAGTALQSLKATPALDEPEP